MMKLQVMLLRNAVQTKKAHLLRQVTVLGLTAQHFLNMQANGTIKGYYEVQQKNFIDNGDVESEVPVEDYVLFDVMEEAGK